MTGLGVRMVRAAESASAGGTSSSAAGWKPALGQIKYTEFGPADAHRVFQHRLENGLEVARRTGDDLQHLRGRGLLLQRLAQLRFEIASACLELL